MKFSHKLDPHWELKFYHSNGLKLRYAVYDQGVPAKDYLFLLPGRGEALEKFNDFPQKVKLKPTTALVVIDHRGQGKSEGFPYHINSYDDYCKDIQNLIKHLQADSYRFFACSMGGLISLYGIQKKYFSPKSLFLISPLISLPEKRSWFIWRYAVLSFLYFVGLGKLRVRRYSLGHSFESNLLTNDKDHFEALKSNPAPPEDGTIAWIRATFQTIFSINQKKNIKSFLHIKVNTLKNFDLLKG